MRTVGVGADQRKTELEQLKAENASLRAEIDRLTALLEESAGQPDEVDGKKKSARK